MVDLRTLDEASSWPRISERDASPPYSPLDAPAKVLVVSNFDLNEGFNGLFGGLFGGLWTVAVGVGDAKRLGWFGRRLAGIGEGEGVREERERRAEGGQRSRDG